MVVAPQQNTADELGSQISIWEDILRRPLAPDHTVCVYPTNQWQPAPHGVPHNLVDLLSKQPWHSHNLTPRGSKLKHLPVTQGRHTSEPKAKNQVGQSCTGPSSEGGHLPALESSGVLRWTDSPISSSGWKNQHFHPVFQADGSQGSSVLVPCNLEKSLSF